LGEAEHPRTTLQAARCSVGNTCLKSGLGKPRRVLKAISKRSVCGTAAATLLCRTVFNVLGGQINATQFNVRTSLRAAQSVLRRVSTRDLERWGHGHWRKPIESTRCLTIAFSITPRAKLSPSSRANSLYRSFRTPMEVDPLRFHGVVRHCTQYRVAACILAACQPHPNPQISLNRCSRRWRLRNGS
jgi:hypothetical protein